MVVLVWMSGAALQLQDLEHLPENLLDWSLHMYKHDYYVNWQKCNEMNDKGIV